VKGKAEEMAWREARRRAASALAQFKIVQPGSSGLILVSSNPQPAQTLFNKVYKGLVVYPCLGIPIALQSATGK